MEELFYKIGEVIEESEFKPHIWGDCNNINATVAKFLTMKGFSNIIPVSGYVLCDVPDKVDYITDPKHFWIKYNNCVLDFASMQFSKSFFDDELNNKMEEYFFFGEFERYNEKASFSVDNEWVNSNLLNEYSS